MPRSARPARKPNVGRSLETGAILGILTAILAATGIGLSPTISGLVPPMRYLQAAFNFTFYVTHLAAAALLVVFTVWHLVPFAYSFSRKRGVRWTAMAASYALLALVLVEIGTGVVLYVHVYDVLGKREAVLIHLVATFVLLAPLAWHAWRGTKVWLERRAAADTAMEAAKRRGKLEAAVENRQAVTRRQFVRLSAYAVAGFALAAAFARYTAGQLAAWRLNFVGDTPKLTKQDYRLRITGLVEKPVEITFRELTSLPSQKVRITHRCVEGWTYTDDFTGARLSDVLALAGGVKPGAKQLVFKSPEVSKQMGSVGRKYTTNVPARDAMRDLYVVWAVGGQDLPPEHGFPVRIMTPVKWGYKACKWLTEIEVIADADYRGYWERLGYHNVGDYPGPIFQ